MRQLDTRPRRVAAGFASIVAIAALLVGVPIALRLLAGSPLPAGLTSLSELRDTVTKRGLPDSTIIKLVAGIGWLAWLQIAAAVTVETVAWIRGRRAPRVRFAGLVQPMVRRLIATAALLASHSTAAALASTLPARPVVPVAMSLVQTQRAIGASDQPKARETRAPASASEGKTYAVVRYDTLWGLAEHHLSDPFRWRELFDLNQGRPQPDGGTLTNPDLIRVGWTLKFPADATGLASAPTLHHPAVGPATLHALPQTTVTPTSIPQTEPTVTATHSTSVATVASSTATTKPAPAPAGPNRAARDPGTAMPERGPQLPWPLIGGGLAAAGAVALLSRLRRVQQRKRPAGHRPRPSRTELEPIERRLHDIADIYAAEFLDLSLRALAAGSADVHAGPPRVLAVRVASHQVELLLASAPKNPPRGFVVTDGDHGWITEPGLQLDDLRALASDTASPLPSLVSIGEIDGEHVLIDLETVGLFTADGSSAEALLHSITLQLATGTWIDHVDVILVTSASATDVAGAARVRRVADLDTATQELAAIARSFDDALESSQVTSTLAARFSDRQGDGWIPTILVSTDPVDPDTVERLRELVTDGGRGVAAAVNSAHHATWHAHVEPDELFLTPLNFHLTPSLVDSSAAEQIDELLTDVTLADNFQQENAIDRPQAGAIRTDPYVDPPFDLEVRVLGPIEIVGISQPIERHRAQEMVVYLALHHSGASDDRVKTVLWPERAPTHGTFNTTVSFARTSLGHSDGGDPYFPHYSAAVGSYRLGPLVTSDLARFEARVAHSKLSDPDTALATLRSALELVRGAPFDTTRGYGWAFSEGHVAEAEAMIAEAAHRLAELYLAAGDHAGATWAAIRGLKACPGDETLYRDRMLACHLAGSPAGIETAMNELCEVVEALEPYDSLHPETIALYYRLSRRRRATTTP